VFPDHVGPPCVGAGGPFAYNPGAGAFPHAYACVGLLGSSGQ
jgi:hypothetical protein